LIFYPRLLRHWSKKQLPPQIKDYRQEIQVERTIEHQEERYHLMHQTKLNLIFQLLVVEEDVLYVAKKRMYTGLFTTVHIVTERFA